MHSDKMLLFYTRRMLAIFILFTIVFTLSCKKTTITNRSDTFFKVFTGMPLYWAASGKNDYWDVQRIVADNAGNLYAVYWDSTFTPGIGLSTGILKTDKFGNMIWRKAYPYFPSLNNARYDDLVCDGRWLYLLCTGAGGIVNCKLIRIDTAGNLDSTNMLSNLSLPAANQYWMNGIQLNNGQIFTSGTNRSTSSSKIKKPFVALFSASGPVIWQNYTLPADTELIKTDHDDCYVEGMDIESDGSYICATNGDSYDPTDMVDTTKLWLYHIDGASGNLLFAKPIVAGYRSNVTEINITPYFFSYVMLFTLPDKTFMVVNQKLNTKTDASVLLAIDIWKIDTGGNILDSLELSEDYSLTLGKTIKRNNGNILISGTSTRIINSPYKSMLYEISPDLTLLKTKEFSSPTQSISIRGIGETTDGYVIGSGLIQTAGEDKANMFIFKTDLNENF